MQSKLTLPHHEMGRKTGLGGSMSHPSLLSLLIQFHPMNLFPQEHGVRVEEKGSQINRKRWRVILTSHTTASDDSVTKFCPLLETTDQEGKRKKKKKCWRDPQSPLQFGKAPSQPACLMEKQSTCDHSWHWEQPSHRAAKDGHHAKGSCRGGSWLTSENINHGWGGREVGLLSGGGCVSAARPKPRPQPESRDSRNCGQALEDTGFKAYEDFRHSPWRLISTY